LSPIAEQSQHMPNGQRQIRPEQESQQSVSAKSVAAVEIQSRFDFDSLEAICA